jgi:tetratricopeptide (TPR) repeat protein
MRQILLLLFLSLIGQNIRAQSTDEKLAAQYFENKEYDKAMPVYADLADAQTESIYLYDRYLACLIELKNWDKAEKLLRKRQRKFTDIALYKVDAGYILEKQGKTKEADKIYAQLVASLHKEMGEYSRLAGAFQKRLKYNWAIETYEKGEKELEGLTDFSSQLAILYLETGNREKGLEKYVNLVIQSGMPFEQSQPLFEMNVTDSLDFVVLRVILLKQIQKMPDNIALGELLKWTFVKQKDWNAAFVQTRALDKKLKEKGFRMIELGELCLSNDAWDAAVSCFEYIKNLGADGPYYDEGENGLLETRYRQLVEARNLGNSEITQLKNEYEIFINRRGISDANWRAISRLAEIEMQYLHKPADAIALLEDFIKTPGINRRAQANAKLQLGDAYIMDDDVWTSELLYAQVEKDFEEEALGQEGKFRRARLSYFRGDFDWAKIQLEVLKGATSQLISNNAIDLALTISENLGIDSNYDALEMYAHAQLLQMQNKLDSAEILLDSIPKKYPGHSLSDDILYARAQIRENQGRYADAAELYETLVIAFNHDILADNGWFALGMLYENQLNNKVKSLEAFKKIVIDFPGSLYNVEARKHYRKLRGDNI